jgi:hypothetical protein
LSRTYLVHAPVVESHKIQVVPCSPSRCSPSWCQDYRHRRSELDQLAGAILFPPSWLSWSLWSMRRAFLPSFGLSFMAFGRWQRRGYSSISSVDGAERGPKLPSRSQEVQYSAVVRDHRLDLGSPGVAPVSGVPRSTCPSLIILRSYHILFLAEHLWDRPDQFALYRISRTSAVLVDPISRTPTSTETTRELGTYILLT